MLLHNMQHAGLGYVAQCIVIHLKGYTYSRRAADSAQSMVPVTSTPVLCQIQCIFGERHPLWHMRGHHESH